MINIDITLLIQVVNFLVALAIINYLIIRPVRGAMARRRAQNDVLRGDADTLEGEAGLKLDGYNARIAEARAEMSALRKSMKAAAEEAAQARLNEAGDEARSIHRAAAGRIQEEGAEARRELDAKVGDFVQVALKSMLG
ncbi:ATP synthase F0 subunit B [Mailhella massiliensis]|uniref:ATP synthase F0 subunit B n=1 Tax=Mailhella massiliensis TaxID=1903261 RepID=A0A921AWU8_9BACT|nr:ATP synthase F0 subunit B [Mailhella massiliensis]HJD97312.1 ATP synthase F0 subunit B [Mailhella massiliensis]